MATAGLVSRRSSSTGMERSCSSPGLSRTVCSASQINTLVKGMKQMVATTLDSV